MTNDLSQFLAQTQRALAETPSAQYPAAFRTATIALALLIQRASVETVAARFRTDLRRLVRDFFAGSIRNLAAPMRQLLDAAVGDAYYAGLREGGISAEEVEPEEVQSLNQLIAEQIGYVGDFEGAAREAKGDKDAERAMFERVDLWVASVQNAGQRGLASAKSNEMVTWRLGAAEEHCQTCLTLNGQRHRRKWFSDRNYFPRTPGAAMDCGGFQCQCTLTA